MSFLSKNLIHNPIPRNLASPVAQDVEAEFSSPAELYDNCSHAGKGFQIPRGSKRLEVRRFEPENVCNLN